MAMIFSENPGMQAALQASESAAQTSESALAAGSAGGLPWGLDSATTDRRTRAANIALHRQRAFAAIANGQSPASFLTALKALSTDLYGA